MPIPRQVLYSIEPFKAYYQNLLPSRDASDYQQSKRQFQKQFQSQTGLEQVIPISRCRFGLYIALKQFITPDRNEVIVCPFTIFDMINMIVLAGGKPVFIDSEVNSVDICAEAITNSCTSATAAILVTHYHTPNSNIEKIATLCQEKKIALIEDCAISLGSYVAGKHVGGFGDFSIFSFGLFKTIAAPYGGGMYVKSSTCRAKLEEQIEQYPLVKLSDLQPYLNRSLTINFLTSPLFYNVIAFPLFAMAQRFNVNVILKKLDNDPDIVARKEIPGNWHVKPGIYQLQSWTKQLDSLDEIIKHRVSIAAIYRKRLSGIQHLILPLDIGDCTSAYSTYPILVKPEAREKIITEMMLSGFDLTKHYYKNCGELEIFSRYKQSLSRLNAFTESMICLPTHLRITPDYADRLAVRINSIIART